MARLSPKLIAKTAAYLNICILPFKFDLVKTRYLFKVKPIEKLMKVLMIRAAEWAVISFGRKGKST